MDAEIGLLLHFIDQAYDKKAWHGPTLKGALKGLSAEAASWRPAKGRHSIWEVAVHCAYWKYAVFRRLTGIKRGSFPYKGSNWFVRPSGGGDIADAWKADLKLLDLMHVQMREAVAVLKREDLVAAPTGSDSGRRGMILGIASHDLYHAGQIQLLKRLRP